MILNELELQRINNTVGEICRRRSPPQFRDELELIYEIEGQDVFVYEVRAHWDNPQKKFKSGIAKFRYIRSRNQWRLYWMRRDLKWHLYDPDNMPLDLENLVRVVDVDRYGAFFG